MTVSFTIKFIFLLVFSKNLLKEENQESQEGKKKSQNSGEPEQNQRLGRYDNML